MRVVNDISERAIALMEKYDKLHNTNEEQNQYLLLVKHSGDCVTTGVPPVNTSPGLQRG